MARYGDLDALEKKLFPIGMVDDGRYALPAKSVKVAIDSIPTADVVSTEGELRGGSFYFKLEEAIESSRRFMREHDAEVAREIFAEIEELAKIYTFPVVKNGVVEIAKEPFWCIEPSDLAELKKKYIGE